MPKRSQDELERERKTLEKASVEFSLEWVAEVKAASEAELKAIPSSQHTKQYIKYQTEIDAALTRKDWELAISHIDRALRLEEDWRKELPHSEIYLYWLKATTLVHDGKDMKAVLAQGRARALKEESEKKEAAKAAQKRVHLSF